MMLKQFPTESTSMRCLRVPSLLLLIAFCFSFGCNATKEADLGDVRTGDSATSDDASDDGLVVDTSDAEEVSVAMTDKETPKGADQVFGDDDLDAGEAEPADDNDAGAKPAVDQQKVGELMGQLQNARQGRDTKKGYTAAKELYGLDKSDPRFINIYAQLSSSLAGETKDSEMSGKLFLQSAKLLGKLDELGHVPAEQKEMFSQQVHFLTAKGRAVLKEKPEAVTAMSALFDSGFSQIAAIEHDPHLSELLQEPELATKLDEAREKLRELFAEEVKNEIAANEAFPFDFNLKDIDGKEVSKADYTGKLLIVDIWGTWCPPCKMEIPHFIKLREKYSDTLDIVGINYERGAPQEAVGKIRDFVESEGVNYTCVIGDEPTKEQVKPGLEGYPTTLFFNTKGELRLKVVGYHPYEKLEAIVQELIREEKL